MSILRGFAPLLALFAAALSAGCMAVPADDALDVDGGTGSARVRVDVYGGFQTGTLQPTRGHLVVDVTALLGPAEPPAPGADLTPLARTLAEGILAPLPGDPAPTLHPFHRLSATAARCPIRAGQTHASEAIGALRRGALAGDAARGAQVILALNFADECAPVLCSAAQELLAAGAWLDLIQVGRGDPPACLKGLPPPEPAEPAALAEGLRADSRPYRVERLVAPGRDRPVVANGRSGRAVRVEPGMHVIVVESAPEIVIGPFQIGAGQLARVRVLDFPLSAPGERSWTIEVTDVAS